MRFARIVGINVLIFLGLLLVLEVAGQVIALVRPSYDVLYMQPDRAVGWKAVPELRFTWAGWDWYAAEFSVDVRTNSHGFRDLARDESKQPGVARVAVLGDSFVEALQVPLEQTATQVLERRLNATPMANGGAAKWEVLNFGISNHGVGQYLLMWESYARRFHPDYVAVFVAKLHMRRTVSKFEYRAFSATRSDRLWVRPTFRSDHGDLVREPARDFDKFAEAQAHLVNAEFGGERSRRKPPRLLTVYYAQRMWDEVKAVAFRDVPRPRPAPGSESELVALNLRVLDELGRSIGNAGARLIVVDVSQYFEPDPTVARELEVLCARRGFGYVPAYADLLDANANGIATRWMDDTHFNEAGNRILANSLYAWIARNAQVARPSGS